jgi:hypothetical protein
MDSGDDLLQNVYAYFLKAYQQGGQGAAQNEVVAFENIGFSPGCSALTGNNVAAAALEEVSHFSDELPEVAGGVYTHTLRTISGTYGNMIDAAESSSAAALVTFANFKSQAQKAYQGGAISSFDGPTSYLPVYPTPIDWYDLNNTGNWQSYLYDASVKAPAPAAPPPRAPNVRIQWRIVPQNMRPVILSRSDATGISASADRPAHPMFMRPAIPSHQVVNAKAVRPAPIVANREIATNAVASSAAASTQISPVRTIGASRLAGLASVINLAPQTQSQPVETPKFTMSFDYCLVRLRRSWFSGDLLATLGWYIPGAHAGDYASGPPANTGPFAAIPTAFIAVKNLVINAVWSDSDVTARANAASFGPFSLLGSSTDDKNSVRNPGIQIIAWICSLQPQLPPDTDPSLASSPTTAPSSDSGSGTQTTGGSSNATAAGGAAGSTTGTAPTSTSTGTSDQASQSASGNSDPTTAGEAAGSTVGTAPTSTSTGTSDQASQSASGSSDPTAAGEAAGSTVGTAPTSTSTGTSDQASQSPSDSSSSTTGSGA